MTGALFTLGVAGAGLNVWNAYSLARRPLTEPAALVANWRSYQQGGHRRGPGRAVVTVVVFSDYECVYCAVTERRLGALRTKYPTLLAEIFYHYPLPGHRNAAGAAKAAVCGADQGYFETLNALLFSKRDSLEKMPWSALATAAGVPDSARFRSCVDSPKATSKLAADIAAGRQIRAGVTPTILINDAMYDGLPADLERLIEREITRHGAPERT